MPPIMTEADSFSIIFEQPGTANKVTTFSDRPGFRPRRFHHKSRNGCTSCKRRRIKCDEKQPACSRCWEKGVTCQYPGSPEPHDLAQSSLPTPPDDEETNEDGAINARMLEMLEQENVPCKHFLDPTYTRADALDLFHHFFDLRETTWIASPACQNVLQEHGFELSQNAPYIIHAILAFSAAHMNHLVPQESKYRIASALHYHRSLQLYQNHLNNELREEDADALFACSILHSILAFVHGTTADADQKLHSNNTTPSWTTTFQGNHILLNTPMLHSTLLQGVWSSIIHRFLDRGNDMPDSSLPMSQHRAGDLRQINALAETCTNLAPAQQALYEEPIAGLRVLAQFPARPEVLGRYIFFMTRLQCAFVHLLKEDDPNALLVLGFWCAFLSRIDQWWTVASAQMECRRICAYIRSLGDPQFIRLVDFLETFYMAEDRRRS